MPSRSVLFSLCAAAALSACDQPAAPSRPEPLFVPAGGETYLPPLAPAWESLPPAPAAPLRQASYVPDYGYAERAYAIDRAFYEAPPDYGFDYMDVEPWAWRTYDGYTVFAEPVAYGYRYYYYEPGYDWPFFIRTPDYAYGYGPGGVLIAVYTAAGLLLPYDEVYVLAPRAGRYWVRSRELYVASSVRQVPVVYDAWLSRRPVLVRSQEPWMQAAVRQPGWRGYRDRHDARELRHFAPERQRREQAVQRAERQEVRQALGREGRDDRRIERVERRDERRAEQLARRDDVRMQHVARPERRDEVPAERRQARPERPERPERQARGEAPRREPMFVPREDRPGRRSEPALAARERPAPRAERPERRAEIRPERPERRPEPAMAVRDRAPPPQRVERPERPAERRAEAPRPQPQQRAEAPRPDRGPERAQPRGADRSGRDAAAQEHGGKPDRPRKD